MNNYTSKEVALLKLTKQRIIEASENSITLAGVIEVINRLIREYGGDGQQHD